MINRIVRYISGLSGEAVRYIIIGALTTLVNFSLFAFLTKKTDIDDTICNVTSISASILFAYVSNKLIVFKKYCGTKLGLLLEFTKFVGSRLFTMALDVGVVLLLTEAFKLSELTGKFSAQILVIIANYLISRLLVFRKNKAAP